MKNLSLRFDIDTHICVSQGAPNLISLAAEYNIKFTFFINLGASVNRFLFLKNLFKDRNIISNASSLSAFEKLGLIRYFEVAMFNPHVSKWKDEINSILENGHELGLHGGRNHASWASDAHLWPSEKVRDEIAFGLRKLNKLIPEFYPLGFASPGWNSSDLIQNIVGELNFKYIADDYSETGHMKTPINNNFYSVNTNLVGRPGGIGYFEHLASLQKNITYNDFKLKAYKDSELPCTWAIAYDHPYYVGRRGINYLRSYIEGILDTGVNILPIKELVLNG